jgi:uncharacterized protein (DUF433 family)
MDREEKRFLDAMLIAMPKIVKRPRRLEMTITDRIEMNPKVMLGKPVIRRTRIPVELILRKLSEGANEADLLEAYPKLTHEDIQAAIRHGRVEAEED